MAWQASRGYERAVEFLKHGDGTERQGLVRAAGEIVGYLPQALPPELWPRHVALVDRLSTVTIFGAEGQVAATIRAMDDAEVRAVTDEIRAIALALASTAERGTDGTLEAPTRRQGGSAAQVRLDERRSPP